MAASFAGSTFRCDRLHTFRPTGILALAEYRGRSRRCNASNRESGSRTLGCRDNPSAPPAVTAERT